MKEVIIDVLADRYATQEMINIWSPRNKILLERRLWIAALKSMQNLGVDIPEKAIQAYELVIDVIDLDAILLRELERRHDVIARIEAFNQLAGYQLVHKGFTSRDLTDNIEQLQILMSMKLVRDRTVAVLKRLGARAKQYELLDMAGRSHNVAGQTITMGKRFTNWAEELLIAFKRLEELILRYPLRGIKGPMGTQQDMITLLGSSEKALDLEDDIREHLGFSTVLDSVGQVYPRSLDFEVVSVFTQLASAPGNMATTIRLMAGQALTYEGFSKSQKGSAGMPHKMNARTCERINGLLGVIKGFLNMTENLLGNQWNEGDVSCSVVRRVALPGTCFALDGLLEATMTVLDEMGVFENAIEEELSRHLPFLSTTRLLNAIMNKNIGREDAHTMIRDNAVAAIQAGSPGTFIERLLSDNRVPLTKEEIESLITAPDHGAALQQIEKVCDRIALIVGEYSEAAAYNPEQIR